MKTAFISGHTDLSDEEFETHYRAEILKAIGEGHRFVIGSAPGGDTKSLRFLIEQLGQSASSRITIFLFEKSPEKYQNCLKICLQHKIPYKTDFKSYTSRDAEMTAISDYDIAWVRSEAECRKLYGDKYIPRISGTQRNLERRAKVKNGKK